MEISAKIKKIQRFLNIIEKDHIASSSAQCAYYVILSFIPFVILLLTLIQYTDVSQNELFELLSNIIPANMSEIVIGIIKEVYSKSIGTVSITLFFTLYSANAGFFVLTRELHLINNSDKKKSFWKLKLISLFQTAIFIVLIAITLVIMVFGKPIISTIKSRFGLLENYTWISEIITRLILIGILFIIFLFVYKFLSGYKIKFRNQIKGALFASIAINIVSFIFSRYLDIFKGFSLTYGSLTALMLIMMWTYACFYVIFIGAEINKIHEMKKNEILE